MRTRLSCSHAGPRPSAGHSAACGNLADTPTTMCWRFITRFDCGLSSTVSAQPNLPSTWVPIRLSAGPSPPAENRFWPIMTRESPMRARSALIAGPAVFVRVA